MARLDIIIISIQAFAGKIQEGVGHWGIMALDVMGKLFYGCWVYKLQTPQEYYTGQVFLFLSLELMFCLRHSYKATWFRWRVVLGTLN